MKAHGGCGYNGAYTYVYKATAPESRRSKKADENFRRAQSETEIPWTMLPHSA